MVVGTRADGGDCSLKEQPMLDLIFVAAGLGFFALSVAYVFGCDHL
jgi:hypothetical protein